MSEDKKKQTALDVNLKDLQTVTSHIRERMKPLININEGIRKSLEPLVERLSFLEPVFATHLKPIINLHQVFQETIRPQILELFNAYKELPTELKEALMLLGQQGWYYDPEISLPYLWEIKDLLATGHFDETDKVLVHYFEGRLFEIEESISINFPSRAHIICSAFEAHRRGDFVLSIPTLLAQADGICKEAVNEYLFIRKDKKPSTAIYIEQLEVDSYMAALLSPLTITLPIGATKEERTDGFTALNRHMVLHGESLNYGNKINSLKTISLVNYVAHILTTPIS